MLSTFSFYGGTAVFLLRAALAAIMVAHGWQKIKDIKKTVAGFESMGFRPGGLWGTIVTLLEFFGGIALLVGFFVPPIAALLICQFIVIIIWKLSKHMPFIGGWEFDLALLAGFIALFSLGGGAYSIDRILLIGF